MTEQNPYSTPSSHAPVLQAQTADVSLDIPEKDLKKIRAVNADAGQFWIAIIACFLCGFIAGALVPIWFAFRLIQWNSLAKKHPALTVPGSPPGSVQAKFRAAQWKLIVGLVFGCIAFVITFLSLLLMIYVDVQA